MIVVRQASLADRPAIFEFIRQAYADRWQYKIPERWQWEFIENPFLQAGELPIWIAVDEEGRVVGQTCALIEPLKLGGETRRVGWSVDTFLDPAHRGQGIGYQLQKANDEANEIFMSLSMSPANRRIKAALGSVPLEPVSTFVRTLVHEPAGAAQSLLDRIFKETGIARRAVAGLLEATRLDRGLAMTLNRARERQDARMVSRMDAGIAISPVESFDEEVDELWETVSAHFHALVRRDHAYLNWKYVQQPHAGYTRFLARREGVICGYVILRMARPPEPNIGILTDLFAAPQDQAAALALIAHGLAFFKRAKAASVTAATSVQEYQDSLRAFGFRKTKDLAPMFHCKLAPPICQRALRPGSWLLGKGDHDWDQYPLA